MASVGLVGGLGPESTIDYYRRHAIEGVILGGTELPLLVPDPTIAGIPALDTTALHVAAIVEGLESGPTSPAPHS